MNDNWKSISGEKYDWSKTLKPERPYIHDYTKALTMKLYLAEPTSEHNASNVKFTFAEAAEKIKEIDIMTPGLPKIIYLVGWQYYGHDSKYPAWHEVNEALKRPEDKTALDSLLWLFDEGYKYNTVVSLHINMYDAYQDSPLWQTYVDKGLICLDKNGELLKAGIWNNQQAYAVSYKREWESGFAKKRIDELCDFLPIKRAGTIHIDALHISIDEGRGATIDDEREARNKICRYWRDLGIDVTSEFLYYETPDWRLSEEQLIGLQPLAYHFSQTLPEYMQRPASLMCGVNSSFRFKQGQSEEIGELFGCSIIGEEIVQPNSPNWKNEFFMEFMKKNLRFLYLNTLERKRAVVTADDVEVEFSEGVTTYLNGCKMTKNGVITQDDGNLFMPAEWYKAGAAIAYSEKGGCFTYAADVIMGYAKNEKLCMNKLTPNGISEEKTEYMLQDGKLTVELSANEAIMICAIDS